MISDRELFVQMIERDVVNLYESIASQNSLLTMKPVQDKIYSYADIGIEYVTNLFFGSSPTASIDEASEMAKLVADDKIDAYREKLKKHKMENSVQ